MWRAAAIIFLIFSVSEITPVEICRYYDVAKHLNLSANKELFSYTIPKRNWKEPLEVGLEFTLVSILSVNEKLQVVTFYFWLNLIWNNEFVSWNPSDFCNITSISLPVNLFWMPDVYIDERADEDKFTSSPYVDLSYNGSVFVHQVYRLTSTCNLDVHAFPFDEQKCNLTFTSSLHSDKQILMKNKKSSKKTNQDSRENYLIKGEWKFEKLRITEEVVPYDGNYSTVVYEISMKRRSIFHVLVLIVPTLTLFLLDMAISFAVVSAGDMIAFKVTLILEISVLSLILNEMLPATSDDPPVIVMYFTGIFMFMVLGILENFLMMYLNEKKPNLLFFKDRKCMSRFWRKKTVDPVIIPAGNVTDETSMENKQVNEGILPETDNANSLVLLKQLSVELQQIRKHLVLEGHQDEPILQDKTVFFVQKGLNYTRLVLSICFLTFIVIKWRQ